METWQIQDAVNRAARGERRALNQLKEQFPNREFRRRWCDVWGDTLTWRKKGSKAPWKRMVG